MCLSQSREAFESRDFSPLSAEKEVKEMAAKGGICHQGGWR